MKKLTLAQRIKKVREFRNYTQQYMATQLGIRQNTYSLIETGSVAIKQSRLKRIAEILDFPLSEFLDEDSELNLISSHNKWITQTESIDHDIVAVMICLNNEVIRLQQQNEQILQLLKSR